MRNILKISLALVFVLGLTAPFMAQDEGLGFGEGAPVIEPNFGSDIITVNPIIVQDGPSRRVINRMYPFLINYDPFTLAWDKEAPRAVANDWAISEDGTVYTFTLGQDWTWSDGTPVTAADFVYFWEISEIEGVSPNGAFVDQVESVVAVDDYTLEITFTSATCAALDTIGPVMYAVPSHVYPEYFGEDYTDMGNSEFNLNMPVSGNDFVFANFRPGEQVTLLGNENYPDSYFGSVIPEGYVFKTVTDQVVQMEQFFAGELTWLPSVPQSFLDEVNSRAEDGEFQTVDNPATTIRFLSLNMADPDNPQNGLDDDGNAIDQGNHPILGDVRVRQALAHAIDYEAINQGVFFGAGVQTASHVLPTSWAYDAALQPYPLDLERAGELLDEAGFTDSDGDGIRECNGCDFAEDGTPLAFTVSTNAGNVSQEALYTILQDAWEGIGFDIDVEFVDFNTLVAELTAQTYDAIGLFWGFNVPDNPDTELTDVFLPGADVVDSGFNTGSYNNARVNELVEQARVLPGCNVDERAVLYQEAFEILAEELPWLWLSTSTVTSAAQADVVNWDPQAGYSRWNIDGWTTQAE